MSNLDDLMQSAVVRLLPVARAAEAERDRHLSAMANAFAEAHPGPVAAGQAERGWGGRQARLAEIRRGTLEAARSLDEMWRRREQFDESKAADRARGQAALELGARRQQQDGVAPAPVRIAASADLSRMFGVW